MKACKKTHIYIYIYIQYTLQLQHLKLAELEPVSRDKEQISPNAVDVQVTVHQLPRPIDHWLLAPGFLN